MAVVWHAIGAHLQKDARRDGSASHNHNSGLLLTCMIPTSFCTHHQATRRHRLYQVSGGYIIIERP